MSTTQSSPTGGMTVSRLDAAFEKAALRRQVRDLAWALFTLGIHASDEALDKAINSALHYRCVTLRDSAAPVDTFTGEHLALLSLRERIEAARRPPSPELVARANANAEAEAAQGRMPQSLKSALSEAAQADSLDAATGEGRR